MDKELRLKIERLKAKAQIYFSTNMPVFIVDSSNVWYWAYINKMTDDEIIFTPFVRNNKGIITDKLWIDIIHLDKYKEEKV